MLRTCTSTNQTNAKGGAKADVCHFAENVNEKVDVADGENASQASSCSNLQHTVPMIPGS